MELFEQASRWAVRFDTPQGTLSVEDLWELPLTSTRPGRANLDDIAVSLNKQIQDSGTVSFVAESTRPDEILKLKFDVVLHIIGVRKEEEAQAKTLRANAEKKQRILELIAHKQDEALSNKSEEELRELAASLG